MSVMNLEERMTTLAQAMVHALFGYFFGDVAVL